MAKMGGWPFAAAMMSGADFSRGFGSDADFSFEFGPRGGRRRRRMFGSGELRLVLLHLLAKEARHGYELIKAIEEMTGGSYAPSPGTIYPTLSLLEDESAIVQAAGDETRKAYEATEAGRKELDDRSDEVAALLDRLQGHGERRRAYATPEMFCAVGNLATVLKNRA
ncbi:PadR family transcriptional regulator, partial [Segeticoccus rhizosphaerae]|uniref:PadR family transcriptional regulator n=1 Tax=Segeticoccus rhizosphaerae TaxID=1104777 RepID=UPI0023B0F68A